VQQHCKLDHARLHHYELEGDSVKILLWLLSLFLGQGTPIMPMGSTSYVTAGNHIVLQNGCAARTGASVTSFAIAIFGAANCNNTTYVPALNDVIVIFWNLVVTQASITGCTDTNSNTWTVSPYLGSGRLAFMAQTKLTTGGNTTVTCSWPSASNVAAGEGDFSGAQNVNDASNFATQASGTSQSLATITTTNANDVILGCWGNAPTATSFTAVAPFVAYTGLSNSSNNVYCEYDIVTSTGTYTPQFTLSTAAAGLSATWGIESQ
jgi:hypothetical protein